MDIKKNMSKYYKFLLYLIIIILVNLVGVNLFFPFKVKGLDE